MTSEPTKSPISPPPVVKDLSTWASFYKNGPQLIIGSALSAILGVSVEAIIGVLFFVAFSIYFLFQWLVVPSSKATDELARQIVEEKIPRGETRSDVVQHLRLLERRYRIASLLGLSLLATVVLGFAGAFWWRWHTTKLPHELAIESAPPFAPRIHKELLRKAPFLEAVIGYLEEEAREGKRESQIVLMTTYPLLHPTPPFHYQLYYEAEAYDIAGYGFRKRPDAADEQYEAVPIIYSSSNALGLDIPSCEKGDRVFIVARLSLNKATQFPSNLAEATKTRVSPAKVKQ